MNRLIRSLLALMLMSSVIFVIPSRVGESSQKTSVTVFEDREVAPRDLNAGLEKSDLVFHPMKSGSYGENWFFLVMLEDGGWIASAFATTNLGIGKFRSSVDFTYYAADGTIHRFHRIYSKKHLKTSEDSFSVKIGQNYAGGEFPNYRLVIDEKELQAELNFICLTKGWKPGDGFLYLGAGKKEFWKFAAPAPRSKVTGHIMIDGKKVGLKGLGHHDHSYANIKKTSYTKVQYVFRMFTEEFTLSLMSIVLRDEYERDSANMLMLAQDDKIIFNTTEFSYVPSRFKPDKDTGYRVPYQFELKASGSGASPEPAFSLEGKIEIEHLLERCDVLEHIGSLQRSFVKAFISKPYLYRFQSGYDLNLKVGDQTRHLTGKGFSEANFMD
ncbi:MAG: hypothetical protein JSU92_14620 [Deltaproteobacteria bacterium]|nr:MAG: hypothetical protein JSU92_14620 [Deltaproteobacteria bacterium]